MPNTSTVFHDKLIHDSNNIENRMFVQGICMEMCPQEEVTLREKEKLIHVLEVTESGHKLVKSYGRSAASSDMAVPRSLRPFRVLVDTVHYLLLEVPKRSDIKMPVMYDFLNDRLRAVRQDMTIQRLPPEECVILLEPMIRFYVYYGYRLCDHSLSVYDPVLNNKYLLECMKWFLNCCDVLCKAETIQDDIDMITGNLNSLDICKPRPELSCDRILVESLYILCHLCDLSPLYRYLRLPNYVKRSSALKVAYSIAIANMNGNFIRVQKLAKRLCPLSFSALCLHRATIQRRGLQVLSHAYNNKRRTFPVEVLKEWLFFNSYEEVKATCVHYGFDVDRETHGVCFTKDSFIENEELQPMKYFQAKILELELEEVLSYTV